MQEKNLFTLSHLDTISANVLETWRSGLGCEQDHAHRQEGSDPCGAEDEVRPLEHARGGLGLQGYGRGDSESLGREREHISCPMILFLTLIRK